MHVMIIIIMLKFSDAADDNMTICRARICPCCNSMLSALSNNNNNKKSLVQFEQI